MRRSYYGMLKTVTLAKTLPNKTVRSVTLQKYFTQRSEKSDVAKNYTPLRIYGNMWRYESK